MLSTFATVKDAQSKDLNIPKSPANSIIKATQSHNDTNTNTDDAKYDTLICKKYTRDSNNRTTDNKNKNFWEKIFNWDIETFNFWIVIVGAFQFLILCIQGILLWITIRGDKLSKRPYVFIKVQRDVFEFENRIDYKVVLKNHGETAAIIKSINILCDTTIYDTSIKLIDDGSVVLGPGEDRPFEYFREFDSKDMININNGNIKLFCYGKIGYRDIFGVFHRTKFCWETQTRDNCRVAFYPSPNKKWNKYT